MWFRISLSFLVDILRKLIYRKVKTLAPKSVVCCLARSDHISLLFVKFHTNEKHFLRKTGLSSNACVLTYPAVCSLAISLWKITKFQHG